MKKKYFWQILAFCIPFFTSLGICIGTGVYPFGTRCILHVDMYHQYCPFFTELLNKLQNGGSLMYTWNQGLGADFVALYAYYLASPFNWLLLFCPKGLVIEFMTVTILLKIGMCGLSFFLYIKEHFGLIGRDGRMHKNTAIPAVICATTYALSGFVAAYSWDIMWMDVVALAPLIILGLELLVQKKKVVLYYVTLAIAIWANYYMSIMVCMFLVLYFIVLFVRQKEGRWGAFGRFAVYSLLAGGTSAVLLIPELLILGYSGSSGITFPKTMEWYFNLFQELSRCCTMASVYTGAGNWPNLYAGAFSLLLLVLFVLNRRIGWKEKVLGIVTVALFGISFANNELDFIWHGFHFPDSLPGRQSFLYIFVVLVIAYATVRKWKGNRIRHILVGELICMVALLVSAVVTDSSVTETYAYVITGAFLLCYGIFGVLLKITVGEKRKLFAYFLAVLALVEVIANMAITGFYTSDRTSYMAKMEDYGQLLEVAEDNSQGEFYRIEDSQRMTKNDDALYGYASATEFSSLMNIGVSHFYQSLYMEGGKNFYCYNGATPLVSAMLSVKYQLFNSDLEENEYRHIVAQAGNSYLYENTYVLPLGYMMSEEAIAQWNEKTSTKIDTLNSLGFSLGAEEAMLQNVFFDQDKQSGSTVIHIGQDGYYYAAYQSCASDSLKEEVSSGRTRTFSKTTHRYLLELGYCKAGDEVTLSNSNQEEISFYVYQLNADAVQQAYETLQQQTMELKSYSDTCVEGTIQVTEEGRLILSIPSEAGWTLYVDGEETEIETLQEALISVHLTPGKHTIRLTYRTPGIIPGAAISIGCVLIFIICCLWRFRHHRSDCSRVTVQTLSDQ